MASSSAASSPTSPGPHFFTADGIRFHYVARGQGPVFVAQSVGWGPSASMLWNTLSPLEASHTVVYFEPRGNGQSGRPADEAAMSSRVMADDLEHLRRHLALEAFPALFGHSNAGCIALAYAERFPARVERLVLVDAEVHDGVPNDNFAQFAARRKDDPVYGPALAALMGAFTSPPQTDEGFAEMMDKILPYYFNDTALAAVVRERMEVDVVPPRIWAFLRQNKLDKEDPIPHIADAGKITAKTLVLWGRDDAFCSLQRAEDLHNGIKGSELVVFEDCGHFPFIEKVDGFWAAMNKFLSE